jgi:hypothetical protein
VNDLAQGSSLLLDLQVHWDLSFLLGVGQKWEPEPERSLPELEKT